MFSALKQIYHFKYSLTAWLQGDDLQLENLLERVPISIRVKISLLDRRRLLEERQLLEIANRDQRATMLLGKIASDGAALEQDEPVVVLTNKIP